MIYTIYIILSLDKAFRKKYLLLHDLLQLLHYTVWIQSFDWRIRWISGHILYHHSQDEVLQMICRRKPIVSLILLDTDFKSSLIAM